MPSCYVIHKTVIEFALMLTGLSVDYIHALLTKNREATLTEEEKEELDQAEWLDYLMTLIKARVELHNQKTA